MLPFDVILFDIGGVILTNGWDHRERAAVLQHFRLDRITFEERHPIPYAAWARGFISIEAYLDETVFYEPRNFIFEEFFSVMCAQSMLLDDSAMNILGQLSSSGKYVLGALNNEPRETNEYRLDHFELRNYFQLFLSSCYLGVCKPEPDIYRKAIDILAKPAERILLIDDRVENVVRAKVTGMQAIRFESASKLEKSLKQLDVF